MINEGSTEKLQEAGPDMEKERRKIFNLLAALEKTIGPSLEELSTFVDEFYDKRAHEETGELISHLYKANSMFQKVKRAIRDM